MVEKFKRAKLHILRYTKKPKHVTSHVFAETTHVVAAPYGFACAVIAPT